MRKKSILISVSASLVLAFSFISCNTEFSGFKKTGTGIYYKIHTGDNQDTTRIYEGSIVTMDLDYGKKDSALFDSRNMPNAIKFPVPASQYEGDFYEALRLFHQGDSGTFILKAGPFFTKTAGQPKLPPNITEEENLYFNVNVRKVQNQEAANAEEQLRMQELEKQEQLIIQNYLTEKNVAVQPTATGIYYIEKQKGKGKSPVTDGYASVHYSVFKLTGEQLFSTYEKVEPVDFKMGSRFENKGFQEVVSLMKEGGKAEALVPSALAFGAKGAGQVVSPYTPLYYHVDLVKVLSNEEWEKKNADKEAKKQADQLKHNTEEDAAIQKYLKDNNLIAATTLPSGLVYVETLKGTGNKPVEGKKVKVHYTGKLLDGTKFDSSLDRGEPFEFTIGRGQVIEGWDSGVALMSVGGKAIILIPSRIGYKDRGAGEKIPPYATLVFDVELLEAEQ